MTALYHWLAPDVLRNLGLALSHFIWQGAAIAALVAAGIAFARKASVRYTIGVTALAFMFAAPVITFLVLNNSTIAMTPLATSDVSVVVAGDVPNLVYHGSARSAAPVNMTSMNWLVAIWFAGVLLFSLRHAGGFFLL